MRCHTRGNIKHFHIMSGRIKAISLSLLMALMIGVLLVGSAVAAPNLVADKSVTLANDTGDTGPGPGDTLTYTITITNSGSTNTMNAILQDAPDANTTFVAGSLKGSPNR